MRYITKLKLYSCKSEEVWLGFFGTRASAFSDASLLLEIVTTILFSVGYFAEKRTGRHCIIMAGAFTVDVLFLVSYMIKRLFEVAPSPPPRLETIYLGIVILHSILSILVLVLTGAQGVLGYKWRKRVSNGITLGKKRTAHKRLGLITMILWYVSFLTGVVVYTILYVL